MTRVTVMFNPKTAPYAEYYLQPLEAVAPKFGIKPFAARVSSEIDIEKSIADLGREPGGGLIAMTDSYMFVHRKNIIALSAQYKIPAMHYVSIVPREGGLISYGIDTSDLFSRAAPYVSRILNGAKPSELPVQLPTKYGTGRQYEDRKGARP